ncbi:tumor necrosis factor receptor superfamily member 14 isoform X4 [Sciurus carolinensis]|uniref:tumor necrosis factor receptor superfamily member 14 isoform X4 n=1 Tax=Sciurus carolinensis TaxID=30640 RepID=UPI001FB1AE3B|nr:tumor necrosis factor receptor superfamily member 14 isoform X4 [Sciurus carolinensis]
MEPLPGWGLPCWSQVPRATALKLTLCLLLLPPRNAPSQLLCREEEYPAGTECCPKCSPGSYHVKQACSELTGTVCIPCPPETYTAHPNGLGQCLPCRVCDPALGMDTRQKCSRVQDTVCGCRQGHFCQAKDRGHCILCSPHTICLPGQRAKRSGTESQDTVCANCPQGTFSPNGTLEQCLPWTVRKRSSGSEHSVKVVLQVAENRGGSWQVFTHPGPAGRARRHHRGHRGDSACGGDGAGIPGKGPQGRESGYSNLLAADAYGQESRACPRRAPDCSSRRDGAMLKALRAVPAARCSPSCRDAAP